MENEPQEPPKKVITMTESELDDRIRSGVWRWYWNWMKIGLALAIIGLIVAVLALGANPNCGKKSELDEYLRTPAFTMKTSDGRVIIRRMDMTVVVKLPDGTYRAATPDEERLLSESVLHPKPKKH